MMQPNKKLILASSSPRRQQLMTEAGYEFEVVAPRPSAECGVCSGETPSELVARLAFQKAADVASRTDVAIIIACDTVAECCGQVLGKPTSREHAEKMLRLMSGRVHHVLSGVCLWLVPENRKSLKVELTRLRMDELDDSRLQDYLESDQWMGKAGAFGYQDSLDWVHIESGTESNVVGLPMTTLAKMLKNFT